MPRFEIGQQVRVTRKKMWVRLGTSLKGHYANDPNFGKIVKIVGYEADSFSGGYYEIEGGKPIKISEREFDYRNGYKSKFLEVV